MYAQALSAQSPAAPLIQLGAVSLHPSVAFRDIGVDSNIRNESADPKQDFTFTTQPQLRATAPIGSVLLTGSAAVGLVYFATYKNEQSVNRRFDGRIESTGARVRPFLAATLNQTRERTGYEIDARVFRQDFGTTGGAEVKLTGITSLTGAYRRTIQEYGDDERFGGVALGQQLDHTTDAVTAGARLAITPLTTVVVDLELQRDRFVSAEFRDADSVRLMPAVEFAPDAVIAGRVAAGFRQFTPRNPHLADFSGLVLAANAATTVMGVTRFTVDATRDVMYSFDPITPYFVVTAARLTVAQRIGGPFDLVAVAGSERLQYQGLTESLSGRVDRTRTVGGGVGLRLSPTVSFTLIYDVTERTSSLEQRPYQRRRLFASATYGV
jgi:hypothetical protein